MHPRYERAARLLLAGDPTPEKFHRRVKTAWYNPNDSAEGCLFAFLGADPMNTDFACPTVCKQRGGKDSALWAAPRDEKLVGLVLEDPRVPTSPNDITRESLPAFAAIQDAADRLLGRDWSEWDRKFPFPTEE